MTDPSAEGVELDSSSASFAGALSSGALSLDALGSLGAFSAACVGMALEGAGRADMMAARSFLSPGKLPEKKEK